MSLYHFATVAIYITIYELSPCHYVIMLLLLYMLLYIYVVTVSLYHFATVTIYVTIN